MHRAASNERTILEWHRHRIRKHQHQPYNI
jgi:hypothetical protein